jgi:hypothetical protein
MEFEAADDPYAAAIELCRRPLAYRAVILCLNSTYREELPLIRMIKSRLRHIDVYLSQTDGRHAALAEAVRMGADGLLADDGLHRIASDSGPIFNVAVAAAESRYNGDEHHAAVPVPTPAAAANETSPDFFDDPLANGDAVLTADELRALLQEQPSLPPSTGGVET